MKSIETEHEGQVLDLAVDSQGKRAATAGDDKAIMIWDINEGQFSRLTTLLGHNSPVALCSWGTSHAAGTLLLTADQEGTVILWKDMGKQWSKVYSRNMNHPVAAVAWVPPERGMVVAAALTDGQVVVLTGTSEQQWEVAQFDAHTQGGCTGVSWGPFMAPGAVFKLSMNAAATEAQSSPARLVTCGFEGHVKIWRYAARDAHWVKEQDLEFPQAFRWTDVQWAPNVGLPFTSIAAGTEDGLVVVWTQDGYDGKWNSTALPSFEAAVCRLSWSSVGTLLLVSCANRRVTMWKEKARGEWHLVSKLS